MSTRITGAVRRLLTLWLALLAAYWLARSALGALLFERAERLDRDFPTLLQLVAIPSLQALALAWATRERGALQLAAPWREALRRPLLRGLLALDGVVFAAAWAAVWLLPGRSWLGLMRGPSLPSALLAGKLLAAMALFAAAVRPLHRAPERLAVLLLAAATLAFSTLPIHGLAEWIAVLSRLAGLAGIAAPSPAVQLGVFAALAVAVMSLLLAAEGALRRLSALAAQALEWTMGLLVPAALLALLGSVRGPQAAIPPASWWGNAAATLASAAATALVLAGAYLHQAALAGPARHPERSQRSAPAH
ncbi:MAG TPA: hypothetical protein VHR45_07865 [Thermoanaerobaculia bacterium]|nr:hypothetical protein [Thermoanaerobaculia bacterium]